MCSVLRPSFLYSGRTPVANGCFDGRGRADDVVEIRLTARGTRLHHVFDELQLNALAGVAPLRCDDRDVAALYGIVASLIARNRPRSPRRTGEPSSANLTGT